MKASAFDKYPVSCQAANDLRIVGWFDKYPMIWQVSNDTTSKEQSPDQTAKMHRYVGWSDALLYIYELFGENLYLWTDAISEDLDSLVYIESYLIVFDGTSVEDSHSGILGLIFRYKAKTLIRLCRHAYWSESVHTLS